MRNHSLVSVIIPAYNAEKFIEKAIDSVLSQTYQCFELIIINDGSTDNTENIIQCYSDARIKPFSQMNAGLSHARNTGIRSASGDYIAFLDADDYWLPEKLEMQIKLMSDCRKIGFCSTKTRVETPDGNFINEWTCPVIRTSTLHAIFEQNGAIAGSGSCVLVRKELQMQVGFFDETLRSLEDIDMWMRYAAISEYMCLPEALTVVTKRPDSMSRNLATMRENAVQVLKKNRALLPEKDQKIFWRSCYAGMLCDYAKWEARSGKKMQALIHLLIALFYSPIRKGRLCISLIIAVLSNSSL